MCLGFLMGRETTEIAASADVAACAALEKWSAAVAAPADVLVLELVLVLAGAHANAAVTTCVASASHS